MEMIIGLIAGAVGGNAAGALSPKLSQGTLINSIAGIVGGGLGGNILSMLGAPGGEGMDIAGIISQVAGGGIGGGLGLAVVGFIKSKMSG